MLIKAWSVITEVHINFKVEHIPLIDSYWLLTGYFYSLQTSKDRSLCERFHLALEVLTLTLSLSTITEAGITRLFFVGCLYNEIIFKL